MSDSFSLLSSESQVTLINPEPTTLLTFTKSSVINTILLLDGKPYISISTVDAAAAITKITDLRANQLLVTIKRRTFHSDQITFSQHHGGEPLKIKQWLEEGKLSNGFPQWTVQTTSGTFVWRTDVTFRWALCSEYDLDHPIAWLQPQTATQPSGLVFKRGTENYRDQIIAAFVILEQKLRIKEKEMSIPDGQFADDRTLLGMHVDTGSFNRR